MPKFKVSYYQDGDYEVFERSACDEWKSVFIGSLADCDAYVRLLQNDDVDFC